MLTIFFGNEWFQRGVFFWMVLKHCVFLDNPDYSWIWAVLDIMVPGADGRELCSTIRRHPGYREDSGDFLHCQR